ncbi:MAG TPA: hypothetical protein VNL17_14655 [Verrucomicrobiae bacterium]|nr:hypothetical protein [Verrucomicrobiae bacterium]
MTISPAEVAALKVPEANIQETVVQYLQLDGWRAFRTELTVQRERGRVVGERGQPDYLFIRYQDPAAFEEYEQKRWAEIMWIEFKAGGEKQKWAQSNSLSAKFQRAWHAAERSRGALVLVVDDINSFIEWYMTCGLLRRK